MLKIVFFCANYPPSENIVSRVKKYAESIKQEEVELIIHPAYSDKVLTRNGVVWYHDLLRHYQADDVIGDSWNDPVYIQTFTRLPE